MRTKIRFTLAHWLSCIMIAGGPILLPAQADTAIFVHGAASDGSTWNYARGLFGSWFPSLHSFAPSLNQQTNLFQQSSQLAMQLSPAGTSILLAHSNGGIVSREASRYKGAQAIATIATPHAGAPIATQLANIQERLGWIGFALADVAVLATLDAWIDPTPVQLMQYTEYAAYAGVGGAIAAWHTATNFLDLWAAFDQDDVPGSSFLTGLPTGGANRFSASVSLSVNAALGGPWILAFSEYDATMLSNMLWGWGFTLYDYANELYQFIEWGSPESIFASIGVGSALYLAWEFQNMPATWCSYVNAGGCFPHDGFIPSANHSFPGGQNTPIFNGPAHTFQTESFLIVDYLRARTAQIL